MTRTSDPVARPDAPAATAGPDAPAATADQEAAPAAPDAVSATEMADLIERLAASEAALLRRVEVERSLSTVGAALASLHDPATVLRSTVDVAVRLLEADGALLDLVDADSGTIRWAYDAGLTDETGRQLLRALELRIGEGMFGRAVETGAVLVTGDYLADPGFVHAEGSDEFIRRLAMRSFIAAPLVDARGPIGVIGVYTRRPNAFGEDAVALARNLASQATIAVRNARFIDELDRSRAEVAHRADAERTLRELAARLTTIHAPDDLLQDVVEGAVRLLGADRAQLDLMGPDGFLRETHVAGPPGLLAMADPDSLIEPHVGMNALAIAARGAVLTADYLADERFPHLPESDAYVREAGIRSVAAAPLIADGEVLGVLKANARRPDAFGPPDAELLLAIAQQAAVALANARLIDELERSQADVSRRADTERTLRQISGRITALRDPDEILRLVVDEAQRLIGSDGAHLALMAEDRTYLRPVVAVGVDAETQRWMLDLEFPIPGGLNGLAAALGRPVRSDDYLVDPRIPHEDSDQYVAARLGIRGVAIVPLRAPAGEIVGTLAVSFRTVHEVDDETIGLLQVLADLAAVAVSNARLDMLLRRSEANYRHLVENSPDLVWAIDEEARFTFLSDTCERLTGWRTDELLGGHFGGLVHPSSGEVAEIDWTAGLSDGNNEIRGRVNLLHSDGHAIPAEFVAVSRVVDGRFAGANGSVRDMSERDRLERELRASEERYRFLVDNSPDIVFSCDADGMFVFLGDSLERLLGWVPSDIEGTHFSTLIDAASQPIALERWNEAVGEPGKTISTRIDLIHRDGRRIPYDVRATAMAVDGVVTGLHGSSRDASERARLEAEVHQSEARFRDLVETSPDGVWQADADGNFTFWSERATTLFGWSAHDVVGRPYLDVVDPSSFRAASEAWGQLVQGEDDLVRARILMRHRDGSTISAEVSGVATRRDGSFAGAQGTVRDLRERERLETDLRRQAGELAARDERAHLARELHDSVTQALFSMTLLTRSVELLLTKDPAAAGERLRTLRDLQRDALAEMRALIFELRPGGLEQDGLIEALRRQATAVQGRAGLPVTVEAELDRRLPAEVEDCLYRIGQEALHNVVKHAAARSVRLTVAFVSDGVSLTVVDDGAGFDPTAVTPGHLGVAGMRARAERIGGRFRVESRAGHGTTIEVIVPVAAGTSEASTAQR